jgi:adenylate cyclase
MKVGGTIAVIAVGLCSDYFPFSAPLERLSFDLPFRFRKDLAAPEVVLVYLDEESARQLQQSFNRPWDRSLHTKLLERLTRDGARLIYYDIVFAAAGPDQEIDRGLAEAIRNNGHVILSAEVQDSLAGDVYRAHLHSTQVYPPYPPFQIAAAGWGVASFKIDADYGVRELRNGTDDIPTASWVAAEKLGAEVTKHPDQRLAKRWLNYFGHPGTLRTVSFHQALSENGFAPGFFRDKIVLIGTNFGMGGPDIRRDQYANPYSRWGIQFSPGLEVHATELLNLTHGNWLKRLPIGVELIIIVVCGLVLGLIGNYLTPKNGVLAGVGFALLISIVTIFAVFHDRVWWNWLVPVLVQTPVALAWSSGSQYFYEARRRAALRQAFAYYLSPQMAERISELDFDLKPGGKVVEASLLFTDCKGFTTVSEELNDPQQVAELLIDYFTHSSRCVLDNGGTIIKYIGDSVMAAWGMPLADPEHPRKAVKAAWELSEASKLVVRGRVLTTRVGVSTGNVLAGNLGSPYRFDYTCIGDTTNLASRLEGMNKMLGTTVLISESTAKRLDNEFLTRLTGVFAVAGKTHGIAVYELLGLTKSTGNDCGWLPTFNQALEGVKAGAFEDAKALFRKTIWERGGEDGPSQFYLKKIAALEKADQLREWTGVVRLDEK